MIFARNDLCDFVTFKSCHQLCIIWSITPPTLHVLCLLTGRKSPAFIFTWSNRECLLFLDVHENVARNLNKGDNQWSESDRAEMMKSESTGCLTDDTRQLLLVSAIHTYTLRPLTNYWKHWPQNTMIEHSANNTVTIRQNVAITQNDIPAHRIHTHTRNSFVSWCKCWSFIEQSLKRIPKMTVYLVKYQTATVPAITNCWHARMNSDVHSNPIKCIHQKCLRNPWVS